MNIFNVLTFIFMLYIFLQAIRRISQGNPIVINFAIILTFCFNGIPLLLDVIIGPPPYSLLWIGYIKSMHHIPTGVIYNFYMMFIMFSFNYYAKKKKYTNLNDNVNQSLKPLTLEELIINFILIILILLPLLHAITSPYILNYSEYGSNKMRGIYDSGYNELNSFLRVSSLGFICVWLFRNKRKKPSFKMLFFFFVFSAMLIWLDGKRNIIAFLIIILFYYLWSYGLFKGKKIIIASAFGMLILIGSSAIYQDYLRSDIVDYGEFDEVYKDYRTDFGRDAVLKLAIFNEITKEGQILEYRGQTFLSTILMYVPRLYWESKPYQYTRYITAEILGISPENVTWGITYSIYDQSIANFGLIFGMLFAMILLIFVSRIGDKQSDYCIKLLVILVTSGLLTMGIAYIAPLIILLLFLVMIKKIKI